MSQPPTLYERLGGVYPIASVVDDFIDRIMVDPRLNANPRVDEAHHRVPPPEFKYLVTEMVCWATGGPQKYTGRFMYDSHKDMKISVPRMGSVHGTIFSRRWTSSMSPCRLIAATMLDPVKYPEAAHWGSLRL